MAKYRSCELCGIDFLNKVGGQPRFCSKHRKVTKQCVVCDTDYKTWRSKTSNGKKSKCCSRNCAQRYATAMRDGFPVRKLGTPGRKVVTNMGYIIIYFPEHEMSNSRGYILEHRLVMANCLGRNLRHGERVHHVNGIRDDNKIENLELRIPATHPNGIGESDMVKLLEERGYIITRPTSHTLEKIRCLS